MILLDHLHGHGSGFANSLHGSGIVAVVYSCLTLSSVVVRRILRHGEELLGDVPLAILSMATEVVLQIRCTDS